MRTEYGATGLDEREAGRDPFALFERWLDEAVSAGVHEPNAMALATVGADGAPGVRIVLLKGFDREGAVFYTNYRSRKADDLAHEPRAAVVMLWHEISRQVRLEGVVEKVSPGESDQYYASRPADSRISATASPQSAVVSDRRLIEGLWLQAEADHAEQRRPEYWGGYRLRIETFEFWQGRTNRLHDRLRFRLDTGARSDAPGQGGIDHGAAWLRERLAP